MNELKNNILNKIKKGEVKKTSHWYFLTKEYSLWTFFGLSIFLGALSFSILLKNIFDDFGPWYKLDLENNFIYSNIFYIWIISIVLFISSAYFNYKHTKKAFKYKPILIILFSLFLSLVLGTIFYHTSLNNWVEHRIEKGSQRYLKIKDNRRMHLLKYLSENNIDEKEFFRNKNILHLKSKYETIDRKRIEKIKEILENSRGNNKEKEMRVLFERIKEKKREIDYKRFMYLIKKYED